MMIPTTSGKNVQTPWKWKITIGEVLEDDQRGKCNKCAELKREIDDFKLMKKRDAVEIEDLRINCMEMDIEVTALSNHEIDLEKELEAYKIKCQGLSAELQRKGTELENLAVINGGLQRLCAKLERKGLELENLRVVNGGLDHEREDYRNKCIGMGKKIKGLTEEGIVMSQKEKSAGERICHLEEVVKKMETDEVSCERTCGDMDGSENAADEAHFTRTETSPNSTFAPCCKPSSRHVNSTGVHVSGDSPHGNNQRVEENALGHQVSCETEGTLTGLRKCSVTPSSENLVLQSK
ncbi:hypothetical protein C5167_042589 [Papaver somniferum]|uniref:Uncharacterized protein n=1 Tax=Papaver somniferum TaxID=3469 RepID=A0A4Y7L6W4_PAPSO|nr:hypothetical protein C5167_042589 [Papaver somniferum]